jgi:hypothetical protein
MAEPVSESGGTLVYERADERILRAPRPFDVVVSSWSADFQSAPPERGLEARATRRRR